MDRLAWKAGGLVLRDIERRVRDGERPAWDPYTDHQEIIDDGRVAALLASVGYDPARHGQLAPPV